MKLKPTIVAAVLLLVAVPMFVGVFTRRTSDSAEFIWGKQGVQDGEFGRPRAIAIDPRTDRMFIVDFTPRIQMFNLDGKHLDLTFRTPDFRNGRPSGLSIDNAGNLIVSDSHYHTVRIYDHAGVELKTLGGVAGNEPGQFGYISDCVQDAAGNYYVGEFGQNQRITKLDADGKFLTCWGKQGTGPMEFNRLRALAIGPDGHLYCADACNHRIQVLTTHGEFLREFGGIGTEPGRLMYPYDLSFAPSGELYVAEYGNHRVQKFDIDGTSLGTWGKAGRGPGQLGNPWALAVDRHGTVHVVDTENHRVQRIKF